MHENDHFYVYKSLFKAKNDGAVTNDSREHYPKYIRYSRE